MIRLIKRLNKLKYLYLSKSNKTFLLFGERYKNNQFYLFSFKTFRLVFSSLMSLRIFENRYYESRLFILQSLKLMELSPKDFSFSISHSGNKFVCLIMPKDIVASVDIEPLNRTLPKTFAKKILTLHNQIKLQSLEYLSMFETFIKLEVLKWSQLKNPLIVKRYSLKKGIYEVIINNHSFR